MDKYKFKCGCQIDIVDHQIKENDGLPSMKIDYYNGINYECVDTWRLISSGKTKGIFQLESGLGQKWSKEIAPENMKHLSAIGSLLRPGALYAMQVDKDGIEKCLTQHYADRKNGKDDIDYFHESLIDILKETYGIMTYQEQSLKIAVDIAGFTMQEADILRDAIGKKKADLMATLEAKFVDGCVTIGKVNKEQGQQIFDWIKESQRYQFNLSHAHFYGIIGYWSAWVKHHLPYHFYTSWLSHAKNKQKPQQEIKDLVLDATNNGIEILPPKLSNILIGNTSNFILNNDKIYFGINDIKGVGAAEIQKLRKIIPKECDWNIFLYSLSRKIKSSVVTGLICSGALSDFNVSRTRMLFEYNKLSELTDREQDFVENMSGTLSERMEELIGGDYKVNVNRKEKISGIIQILQDPPYSLEDSVAFIHSCEAELLGISLTVNKVDGCLSQENSQTCSEFNSRTGKNFSIPVEILRASEYIIKRGNNIGQKMGFVDMRDSTGSIKGTLFSDGWKKYKYLLKIGNTVLVDGSRSDKYPDSLTINKVSQI